MKASDFLRDNIETSGVSGGGNVNKIINSNGRISQRSYGFNLNGTGDYTADRVYCTTSEQIEVRPEMIFSNTEGSLNGVFNPFQDDNEYSYQNFNGDSTDVGGNYDGTDTDIEYLDYGNGKVAVFNGDSSKIQFADMVTADLNVNTVFMKIKFIEHTVNGFLYGAGDDGNDNDDWYEFGEATNIGEIGIYSANSDGDWNNLLTIPDFLLYDGCEHTYGVSIDSNGVVKLSRDGLLFGTYNYSPIEYTGDNAGKIQIGKRYDDGWDYPNMYLKTCRVFKSVLTEEQMKQLHIESLEYIEQPHIKTTLVDLNNDETQTLVPYQYNFEGQHLYKEIVNEESLAISFDFLATQKGQYSLALVNMTDSDNPKSYVTKFEYNSDVMERITVVVPTKDIGYVRNDEELGCKLYIASYDTNITTDTEGLQDGEYITLSNSIVLAKGDSIKITNVQVEAGEIATDYVEPDYNSELQRCMRYYEVSDSGTEIITSLDVSDGALYYLSFSFKTKKRIKPLIKFEESGHGSMDTPYVNLVGTNYVRFASTATDTSGGGYFQVKCWIDAEL